MAWVVFVFVDKAVFVFVGDVNATLSGWTISITDLYRRDTLEFCNLSGCEKLVCYPPCNRLDKVCRVTSITDA